MRTRANWWEIAVPVALLILQLFIGLGMYALNLRFRVVEVQISGVEKRLEDHMQAPRAGKSGAPSARAVATITRKITP